MKPPILPDLPPKSRLDAAHSKNFTGYVLAYTDVQMQQYGVAARTPILKEVERLEVELDICRSAIEKALILLEDWAYDNDTDSDTAAERCTRRELYEAIKVATPRFTYERIGGQHLYGLNYRDIREENMALRYLLALKIAGSALYCDDNELQDNSKEPFIDYKRDTVEQIKIKLLRRGLNSDKC